MKNLNLKDDFDGGINRKIWDLRRIEKGRWLVGEWGGRKALKIVVGKGDKQGVGNDGRLTERSEFSEKEEVKVPLGTRIWYSFGFYFPKDFPVVDNRLVFAQWKQSTVKPESPFLSLRYIKGELVAKVVFDEKRVGFKKRGEWGGKWHEVVVNYQLDKDNQGMARVWIDGDVLVDYVGEMGSLSPTTKAAGFKMGLYRDRMETPQTIYLARFRRGLRSKDGEG